MFEMFWFFGPAIAAVLCTVGASTLLGTGATATEIATKVGGALCTVGAGAAAIYGAPAIEIFGVIMAMATGLAGWILIWIIVMMSNKRLLTENASSSLWLMGSLAISEVPFLGALPALTGTMLKLYSAQIKKEKAAMQAYEKEHAGEELQERQQQAAERMRYQVIQEGQVAQIKQQEAADDDQYTQKMNKAA
jgi:hypothetical protein